jgi:hypothetical protein
MLHIDEQNLIFYTFLFHQVGGFKLPFLVVGVTLLVIIPFYYCALPKPSKFTECMHVK